MYRPPIKAHFFSFRIVDNVKVVDSLYVYIISTHICEKADISPIREIHKYLTKVTLETPD